MRGDGSCSSGDRGPGRWLCTGWTLWTCMAQPWEGPGTRVSGVHKSGLRRRGQSPGSHCRLPSMFHGPQQECTTSDTDYVIQEAFHVFLGVCSGNAAGTAVHTLGRILGWLPGRQATLASCVLGPASRAPPMQCHLPGKVVGKSWVRDQVGGDVCQGWESLCLYPPMQPQTLTLKCYL